MTSIRADLAVAMLRASGAKDFYADVDTLHREMPKHQRTTYVHPPRRARRRCRIDSVRVHGSWCHILRPRDRAAGPLRIMHLHGGGFVEEIERHHWNFAVLLVESLGCSVVLPIYPLVPAADHSVIVPLIDAVYRETTAEVPPEHRVVSGDSAGGALTMALAQRERTRGNAQPGRLLLLSPWLDMTLSDPLSRTLDPADPMLGVAGLQEAGRLFASEDDPTDPEISPARADLIGLGPLMVLVGTRDVLLPEARRLLRHALHYGVEIDYSEYPGMFHNWMMHPLPEGRMAMTHLRTVLTGGYGAGT